MTRRFPWFASVVVMAAIAAMIGLGVWQLQRARWKEGLLDQYASADRQPPIAWPGRVTAGRTLPLFRRTTANCADPKAAGARAGGNRAGETGYVFLVDCAGDGAPRVELGWSKDPAADFRWNGGPVSGVIAPDGERGIRLVADRAPPGLEPSAKPSLSEIPNNHRFYAVQWFAFAAIAAIIFVLAARSKRFQRQ